MHDAKALRVQAADDTLIAAYLIDPGRAEYSLEDLSAENGLELEPEPAAEEETAALVRHAEAARRLAPLLRERVRERGLERLYDDVELPLTAVLAAMEDAGVRIDTYRMGEITARLSDRVEELEARAYELAGEEFVHRLADAARPDPLREARPHAGPEGQDGLLDRRQGAASDPRRPRDRPRDRGVARADEAREHVPRAAADADRRGRAPAHDHQPARRRDRPALDVEPEPAGDPDPHRARPRDPLGIRRRAGQPPALGRLLADRAPDPCARLRRAEAARGVPPRRGHPHRDRRGGAREGPGDAHEGRARGREDDQLRDRLRDLGVRALREPRHPQGAGAGVHRLVPRALPACAGVHRADDRAGQRRTGTRRACSGGAAPCPSFAPRTGRRAASASASPSTSSCRGRTPTSSRSRWSRSTRGCATRAAARGSSSRCTTSCCSRCPETEVSAVRDLVREEMVGAYPLDPPLAVDVGIGDDWAEAKVATVPRRRHRRARRLAPTARASRRPPARALREPPREGRHASGSSG